MNQITHESDLYHLWEECAVTGLTVSALDDRRITVLSAGLRNASSGPDYTDAVLLVEGAVTVGPVEMHLRESDWYLHGHETDPAYAGVVLHVLADPPLSQQLPLPTVTAADLLAAADAVSTGAPPVGVGSEISPDFIAELSWQRLLRRALLVLRSLPPSPELADLRRAFVPGLFDALGYMTNRGPMREVAATILQHEDALARAGFDEMAGFVFGAAGLSPGRIAKAGSAFMSESRLRAILDESRSERRLAWDLAVRTGATPERRLWGSVKVLVDLYRGRLLSHALGRLAAGADVDELARMLVVRMGTESFIGLDRGREIVINAVLPLALAAGAARRDTALIAGSCRTYREAPSLASNRIVRSVERRWLRGSTFVGAFWQQGAIELHQRFLAADRSGLSFIAEPSHNWSRLGSCATVAW